MRNHYAHLDLEKEISSTIKEGHLVRFFEGYLSLREKKVLYVLAKAIPVEESADDMRKTIATLAIAQGHLLGSTAKGKAETEKSWHRREAVRRFNACNVPKILWKRDLLAIGRGLYERYATDSDIIVPGYELSTSITVKDKIISE